MRHKNRAGKEASYGGETDMVLFNLCVDLNLELFKGISLLLSHTPTLNKSKSWHMERRWKVGNRFFIINLDMKSELNNPMQPLPLLLNS